jgi:SAM-dependent methyltransferase
MPNAWLRYDVVTRLLPAQDVTGVLEIGCGQGGFGARLAQRYPSYTGVELDPTSAAVATARLAGFPGAVVRTGALSELEPDRVFDLVCAFEVLEHLDDDAAALAEWVARVRPGGHLMLSVPAHAGRMGAWDEMVGHYRRYDLPVLADLLRDAGLEQVTAQLYGGPLGSALEGARNVVARRRGTDGQPASMAERTAGSGRQLQADSALRGAVARWTTAPFCRLQRIFPGRGTGLVARAMRPGDLS